MASYPIVAINVPGVQPTEDLRRAYSADYTMVIPTGNVLPVYSNEGKGNASLAGYWHLRSDKMFECACGIQTSRRGDMERHIIYRHMGVKLLCTHPGCNSTSVNESYFTKQHPRKHSGNKRPCPNFGCDQSFVDDSALKKHMDSKCKFRNLTDGNPLAPLTGSQRNARAAAHERRRQRNAALRSTEARAASAPGTLPGSTMGFLAGSAMTSPGNNMLQDFDSAGDNMVPSFYDGTLPDLFLLPAEQHYNVVPGPYWVGNDAFDNGAQAPYFNNGGNPVFYRAADTGLLHMVTGNDLSEMTLINDNNFAGYDYSGTNQGLGSALDDDMVAADPEWVAQAQALLDGANTVNNVDGGNQGLSEPINDNFGGDDSAPSSEEDVAALLKPVSDYNAGGTNQGTVDPALLNLGQGMHPVHIAGVNQQDLITEADLANIDGEIQEGSFEYNPAFDPVFDKSTWENQDYTYRFTLPQ